MLKLTYRGLPYNQENKSKAKKNFVKLTYRKSIYSTRRDELLQNHADLKYRGISYKN